MASFPAPETSARRAPARRWRRIGALVALALLAGLAWYWRPLHAQAVGAVSYGARVACACRYVAGRELGACRRDFLPGMSLVVLGEDPEAKSVTARAPLLASHTVTWREGRGCVPEPWAD